MDALPDTREIEALVTLVLREADGPNPVGLLERIERLVGVMIEKARSSVPLRSIDTGDFAPPGDPNQVAAMRTGVALAMNLIRRDAAGNAQRKEDYDMLAQQPDGAEHIRARQKEARRALNAVVRRLLRTRLEALEAKRG